jgi:ferritin-like metal-binding protein YciE
MAEKTLSDLFLAHLKDIYYAEKKIYRTLPTMVKAANDAELRRRLRRIAKKPRAKLSALNRYSR